MIVTPLMWSSLDFCSKYYAIFWIYPFEWDVSRKKFIVNRKSSKLIYYLISMMAIGLAPVVCLTLLGANYLGDGKLAFVEVLVTVMALLITTLTIVTELSFSSCSHPMQLFSNYLVRLDNQVQSRTLINSLIS